MSELQAYLGDHAIPELFNRLYGDAERLSGDIERLQRFVELTMAERVVGATPTPTPTPAPEPSASAPVEMDAGARQRLEEEAKAAAKGMVLSFELLTHKKQSTATSLAAALRVSRMASSGFECPHMMAAILQALDGMDAAAREEQSNG